METGNEESNSAFISALQKIKHENSKDFGRREKAHVAILDINIEVLTVNLDNTDCDCKMSVRDFDKYNMSNKARVTIKGSSEAECIKRLKTALEKINDS